LKTDSFDDVGLGELEVLLVNFPGVGIPDKEEAALQLGMQELADAPETVFSAAVFGSFFQVGLEDLEKSIGAGVVSSQGLERHENHHDEVNGGSGVAGQTFRHLPDGVQNGHKGFQGLKLTVGRHSLGDVLHNVGVPVAGGGNPPQSIFEAMNRLHGHRHAVPTSLHWLDDLDVVGAGLLAEVFDEGASLGGLVSGLGKFLALVDESLDLGGLLEAMLTGVVNQMSNATHVLVDVLSVLG